MAGPYTEKSERLLFIDIAKALILCLMPIAHFYEESLRFEIIGPSFPTSAVESLIGAFYCVGPTLFMFCMGVGMVFTKHNSVNDFIRRGLILIAIFFVLNLFRFILPLILSIFTTGSSEIWEENFTEFFVSDILCFAGLAFIFFALIKRFGIPNWVLLTIGFVLSLIQLAIPEFGFGDSVIGRIATDITGWFVYTCPNQSFFPLIGWIIFPIVGYIYGQYLLDPSSRDMMHRYILIASAAAVAVILFISAVFTHDFGYIQWSYQGDFYLSPMSALFSLLMCMIVVCILYEISKHIVNQRFIKGVTAVSKEINGIYCIHWMILIWLIIYPIYTAEIVISSPVVIALGGLLIFAVSAFLSPRLREFRKRKMASKNASAEQ